MQNVQQISREGEKSSSFNRTNLRSQLMDKLIIGIFISMKTYLLYIIKDGKLTILYYTILCWILEIIPACFSSFPLPKYFTHRQMIGTEIGQQVSELTLAKLLKY